MTDQAQASASAGAAALWVSPVMLARRLAVAEIVSIAEERLGPRQGIPACCVCGATAAELLATNRLPGQSGPMLFFACDGHAEDVDRLLSGGR